MFCLLQTIDRGSRGINFVLTAMVFNVAPTIFELGLVSSLLVSRKNFFILLNIIFMNHWTDFITLFETFFRDTNSEQNLLMSL